MRYSQAFERLVNNLQKNLLSKAFVYFPNVRNRQRYVTRSKQFVNCLQISQYVCYLKVNI